MINWHLLFRQFNGSELGTLEWDTINPDCLIRISNVDTYDFLLNPLIFGYSREKSKTGFLKLEFFLRVLIVPPPLKKPLLWKKY